MRTPNPTRSMKILMVALALLALSGVSELAAQGTAGGVPSLRAYWHVFIAYAAAWLLILGWVVSIARRLARLERALDR